MSSRTSKRPGSNFVNNQEDLKFKKVIDTYRSSKHSLFTLVQNEISRQSLDQIGYLEDMDFEGIEAENDETERSLVKLNGEYKKMQNQLNRLINGDHLRGGLNHLSLHDGTTGRYVIERNACSFFKAERKNPQLSVLRVVAKIDYGEAKIYGSSVFQFPNYANNAMRNANLQGQTFYFQPEDHKGLKFIYLSIEATKKTAVQMNVKFVRGSETQKVGGKFDPNVSLFSNPNAGTEGDQSKKNLARDAANMSLFKAFMQGKAVDQQVRLEVLAKAKQVRLQKMRMMVSLKQKLEEDLHYAKEINRTQKMRNYFEKERLKSEMVRRKKEEIMTCERKHKVALMKKIEITRYLRMEENKRLMKLKRAEYFTRKWAGAVQTCAALDFIKIRFQKLRDIELRKMLENKAAFTIQRCFKRYMRQSMGREITERARINAKQAFKTRGQLTQDLARHTARCYVLKFLKDGRRIQQVSTSMVQFVEGVMRIQKQWKEKADKMEERVLILKYYVDRLCDLYLQLKKKKIADGKLKKRIEKKITGIMSFDGEYLKHRLKEYCWKKRIAYLKHRDIMMERLDKAPYEVKKMNKALQFFSQCLPEDGLQNYEIRLENKLQIYFTEHYKKYLHSGSSARSTTASSGFFKRQGTTLGLVERAGTKSIEESKMVEAQGRTSRGLTVTPLKRKGTSSVKAGASHSKGTFKSNKSKEALTHEDICEREPREKKKGAAGGQEAEYERYVRETVKKSLFVAKFDFIPEVDELEEEILKIS